MQLTFEQLERAMAPIEELGRAELVFPVNGTPVTLRILTPEEESESQKFAAAGLGDDESFVAATSFLERLKLGILSYSIAKVADQDFRGGDGFTETGEVLDGKKVRVPQHLAIRKLILRWPGAIRSALFRKYAELLGAVQKKTDAAIQFDPSDKAAEIERLEKLIAELKAEMEPVEKGGFSSLVTAAAAVEESDAAVREGRLVPQFPVKEDTPHLTVVPQDPVNVPQRKPIVPDVAVPPMETSSSRMAPMPQQVQQPQVQQVPDFEDDGSLIDLSDSEAVEQAMARENIRLMAMRRGVPIAEPPSAIGRGSVPIRPPHVDALDTQQMYQDLQEQIPVGVETLNDRPVYRMPPQELTVNQTSTLLNDKAQVNVSGEGNQSRNPRFVPPKP